MTVPCLPHTPRVLHHGPVAPSPTSTPFLPSFRPALPQTHTCLGPLQAPSIATDLQAEALSSQIYLLPSTPWASAPPSHACSQPRFNLQPQPPPCAVSPATHVPPSPLSGRGDLGFSSFAPVMGDASEEPRVKHPMVDTDSGLLCPGRRQRVHTPLPGSRALGGQWAWHGVAF